MTSRKPTISVVIPAYNESGNIENAIKAVMVQKLTRYQLLEIIVACDGCTDNTVRILTQIAGKYPQLRVIAGLKRKGKCYRLNQLYQQAKGDIVIQLDADGVLAGPHTLQTLVQRLKPDVVLVSGNNQPIPGRKLFIQVMNAAYDLWYQIRKNYRRGDNIFNFHGQIGAMPAGFAKAVHYPPGLFADQHYLYIRAKNVGRFVFEKKAVYWFMSPANFADFLTQAKRSIRDRDSVVEYLGQEALSWFQIDPAYKIRTILGYWINHPLLATYSLVCLLALRLWPINNNFLIDRGVWKISASTKNPVYAN